MCTLYRIDIVNDIRLGEVRVSDMDGVVAVHCAAFPTSAMTKLGREAVRRYYAWQVDGPHETYFQGAWRADELVGFCVGGIHPKAISGFLQRNTAYLAWRVATHPWLVANPLFRGRLSRGLEILKGGGAAPAPRNASAQGNGSAPPKKRPYDILSIAVHPDTQGTGVGKLLLHQAEEKALENGFHVMTLFVNHDNEQAIKFYERCGWERSLKDGVWRGSMVKWLNRPVLTTA